MEKKVEELANSHVHLNGTISNLEKTLQYQRHILASHNIPKKYKPPHTPLIAQPNNGALQESFYSKYKILFFQHLNEVLSTNTLSLEIKKMKLQSIIQSVETMLVENDDQQLNIQLIFNQFIKRTGLTNYTPCYALQQKLPSYSPQQITPLQPQETFETAKLPASPRKPENKATATTNTCSSSSTCTDIAIPQNKIRITEASKSNPKNRKTMCRKRKSEKPHPTGTKKQQTLLPFLESRLTLSNKKT